MMVLLAVSWSSLFNADPLFILRVPYKQTVSVSIFSSLPSPLNRLQSTSPSFSLPCSPKSFSSIRGIVRFRNAVTITLLRSPTATSWRGEKNPVCRRRLFHQIESPAQKCSNSRANVRVCVRDGQRDQRRKMAILPLNCERSASC